MRIVNKFLRAARLDRRVFEEVRWDDEVTGETIIGIAVISLVQYVVFAVLGQASVGFSLVRGLLESVILGAGLWLIASLALWLVGTYIFKARRAGQEVVRVVGVSYIPYVLLGAISIFWWIPILAAVWFVAILTVGVSVLYGFPTTKAFSAAFLAVVVWFLFIFLLF